MRDGVERGWTQGFPGPKTETGVVQRTPHGLINDEPSTERPTVVGATCANGEELSPAARQDHIVTSNLSLDHASIWNAVDSHTGCEIRYNTAGHVSVLRNDSLHVPPDPEFARG